VPPRRPDAEVEPPRIHVDPAQALENKWLELWYQPKIDLRTNKVQGAEALLRLRHPDYGVLAPASFLPPSSDPLHRAILEFVLRRTIGDWERLGKPDLRLSINVPASAVCSGELVPLLRSAIPKTSFPGLIFEVAEDEVIRDASWAYEVATQLKLYNVLLSIDDFGSGVATLGRLCDLPFCELKLDRTFVAGCATIWANRAQCEAAVKLARVFNATVCAEGVESREDLAILRQLGFDSAQGYLFGRPMPPSDFATHVLGHASPQATAPATQQQPAKQGARLSSVA
jgi:EAL domain-containing protein (putative c-di-GMP-specific phosphodiesterase class I)